jgi:hypothetical protein
MRWAADLRGAWCCRRSHACSSCSKHTISASQRCSNDWPVQLIEQLVTRQDRSRHAACSCLHPASSSCTASLQQQQQHLAPVQANHNWPGPNPSVSHTPAQHPQLMLQCCRFLAVAHTSCSRCCCCFAGGHLGCAEAAPWAHMDAVAGVHLPMLMLQRSFLFCAATHVSC